MEYISAQTSRRPSVTERNERSRGILYTEDTLRRSSGRRESRTEHVLIKSPPSRSPARCEPTREPHIFRNLPSRGPARCEPTREPHIFRNLPSRSSSMPGDSDTFDIRYRRYWSDRNKKIFDSRYRSSENLSLPVDDILGTRKPYPPSPGPPRRKSDKPKKPSGGSGYPLTPIGGSGYDPDDDPTTSESESEPESEPKSETESEPESEPESDPQSESEDRLELEPETESEDGERRNEGKPSDSWSEIPSLVTTRGRPTRLHVPLPSHSLSAPSSPTYGSRHDSRWSQYTPLSLSPPQYPNSGSRSSPREVPGLPTFRFDAGEGSESDGHDSEDSDASEIETVRQRLDNRLTHPRKWIERLELLEAEVVINSTLPEFQKPLETPRLSNVHEEILHDSQIIQRVLKNIDTMRQVNFCGPAINALIISSERPKVAILQRIDQEHIKQLYHTYLDFLDGPQGSSSAEETKLLKHCFGFLDHFSLGWSSMQTAIQNKSILDDDLFFPGLLFVSRAVSRFLDLATVSYCGAHLVSFDKTYLDTNMDQFSIPCDRFGASIVMSRRLMKCLDGYFRGRPVWVFQTLDVSAPRSSESLYMSTTIDDFADVFGPVWQTTSRTIPTKILKYNVGMGYVIPWTSTTKEPYVQPGEVLCHWTTDVEDLQRADDFPNFPEMRLLIGGAYLTRNSQCCTTQGTFTREVRQKRLCREFGTSWPSKYRDSQSVSIGLSGYGFGANYSEGYKIREGVTLKDAQVAAWTSKSEDRDIEIIKHWYGVEVSACTDNARRRTIFQLLQSSTMRRYLKGHMEDVEKKYQRKFFSLLNDGDVDAFIKVYKRKGYRQPFSTMIGKCFEVLKRTGTDSEFCLTAFWAPHQGGTFEVQYQHILHRWTGLLADSPETCTFAIVTDECLELYRGDPACQDQYQAPSYRSVLETSVVVNQFAPLPNRRGNPLPKGFKFDLGNAGRLKVLRNLRSGIVVDWSKTRLPAKRAVQTWFRSGKIKLGTAKWHNELVSCYDRENQTVAVLVVSDKRMDIIVAPEHDSHD